MYPFHDIQHSNSKMAMMTAKSLLFFQVVFPSYYVCSQMEQLLKVDYQSVFTNLKGASVIFIATGKDNQIQNH